MPDYNKGKNTKKFSKSNPTKQQYAAAARKHMKDVKRANTPAKIDQSGAKYGKSVKKVYRTL